MIAADPVLVVVPTRDRPALLAQALASVLAQTDRDFVVVVADDGTGAAVDDSPSMPRDARISVVRAKAGTAGGARNAGRIHGEERVLGRGATLIAFLDDDDLWLPDHLARSRAALAEAPDALFVHGAAITRRSNGEAPYQARDDGPFDGNVFAGLLRRNFVATSSVVVRGDAIRTVGGFRADVSHGEDHALWLELAHRGPVAFVPEPTVVHRDHDGNISHRLVEKALAQAEAFSIWWPRRSRLAVVEQRLLRRELARRHRRYVKRLLDDGTMPRREIRAIARHRFLDVPHLSTLRAVAESLWPF